MTDLLETLGRTLGFSFAAGINLYATIAVLGLTKRLGWVALPPELAVFSHGAIVAVAALGEATPVMRGLAALFGWSIAAGSHFGKAGTRAIVNASPEPFTNWALSLSEDVLVVALAWVTLTHPILALALTTLLLVGIVVALRSLWRALRGRVGRWPGRAPPPA